MAAGLPLYRGVKLTHKPFLLLGTILLVLVCWFDTAQAQNNTLSANPSQLTFNAQGSAVPPDQGMLVSSSDGPVNVTVAVLPANSWLSVNATAGTTPFVLVVSIGAGVPSSGTTVGYINIKSAGSSLSVPVVLNVNSTGSSPFSVNPHSLSFSLAANSKVPVSQTDKLSSSSSSVMAFTATPVTSDGGNWLSVSPPAGSLSGTPLSAELQVQVNPEALQGAGPFDAAVAINAPGTTGVVLPVLVTVAGTPSINVSPSQISFEYQIGTTVPPAQTLLITSSTGTGVSFTLSAKAKSCGGDWITLSQQSGATPSTISVQVNPLGLVAGNCTGEVDISAPGASNSSITVPVSLLASTKPLILLPSSIPPFTYQLGSNVLPPAQNVLINSSTAGLAFTASAAPVSGGPDFLLLVNAGGTTPDSLLLSVDPAVLLALGPGTYSETVTVSSTGAGNSPQTFPVTLQVNSNPILTANVQSLNFNFQVGKTAPPNQTITVSSTAAPLTFQVAVNTTSCAGFLSATPPNGSTFGSQNQVVVSVHTAGILPQACTGNITLTVPGSTTPPLVIPVTLDVSNTPLLNVSQPAINVTLLTGAATATQSISVTSTDSATAMPFTAAAATSPIGLTWLGVTPNSGHTPSNLQVTMNPAGLAAGAYTGTITVSSTGPDVPSQTVPVTMVVASSSVTASPANLTFAQLAGGSPPANQTVQVAGVPSGTTIGAVATMLNGSGWLAASVAGNAVTVGANGSELQSGTYSGVVTVLVPGAVNSPLNIPVTFNVSAVPTLSLAPQSLSFSYQAGSATLPAAQTVQVTSTGSNEPFTATFTPASGGNFVTLTPSSGNTPKSINVALNGAVATSLAAGNYSGTLTVSSANIPNGAQTIPVGLVVTPAALPSVASITSGASLQPGAISPGEIVTIFGAAIGPALSQTGIVFAPVNGKVPTSLGGVTVTFNGSVEAPLLFVSANQINCIVPYEMAGQPTANIVVQFGGMSSAVFQVRVVDTAPAIFSISQMGDGQGAILNQNYTVNGAQNPAQKGSIIMIFATGEGQLVPGVATGSITPGKLPVSKPEASVSVSIGGQPVEKITYAGEAPALVSGVIQINATIPSNIGSGNQPVVLTIGNNANIQQNITVAVK